MNKNVSASFTLSLLVVSLLRRRPVSARFPAPDPLLPAQSVPPIARPVEDRADAGPTPPARPLRTESRRERYEAGARRVALARSRGAASPRSRSPGTWIPVRPPAVEARKAIAPRNDPTRPSHGPSTSPLPEPRGAFTSVRAGETLPDVARRVYGPGGDVERPLEGKPRSDRAQGFPAPRRDDAADALNGNR